MKALTLTQPWATLIALGEKYVETRSWSTAYRGPVAIHAARANKTSRDACELQPHASLLQQHDLDPTDLPYGAVIAIARLVDVVRVPYNAHPQAALQLSKGGTYPLTRQERQLGNYAPGRYAWILDDVRALRVPVVVPGALGLWECPLAEQELTYADREEAAR